MNAAHKWRSIAVLTVLALALAGCGTKPQQTTQGSQPTAPSGSQSTTPQQPAAGQTAKKSWSSPPEMKIDANKSYQATVTTNKGTFKIELFAKEAPKTVNNFVFLSKEGFYNNVVFHRIIKSFMVQTGDPEGTGRGGPGYKFEDELKTTYKYEPGMIAMANAGPNTNGSQFFICTGEDSKNLNKMPNYTIFGKVIEGMDIVQAIAGTPVEKGPTGEESKPKETVTIQSIAIAEK
jgi:cyclophilin family peptidyl-prolyl cis-trans isomerase